MNSIRTVGDFVWWVKRTVSNAVVHSRAPKTVQDIYDKAQYDLNYSLKTVMGDLEPMTEEQIQALQGYIKRTIHRRENIRPGKVDSQEDMAAQEKDDADLKASFLCDWSGLI